MKRLLLTVCAVCLLASNGSANEAEMKHEMPPAYEGSAELQKIKELAGKWMGKEKMGGEMMEFFATYHVTSNGSAVVETLHPGTPMEMVSVYTDDKQGKLSMVHYCALANQPKMDLKASTNNEITLDFADDNDIDLNEWHMHGLVITFNDDGSIKHNWSSYKDGEPADNTIITLNKVE